MARINRAQSQERMRNLARIIAEMEAGIHVYSDGRSSVNKRGEPVISQRHAMLEAGYAPTYLKVAYKTVLQHPYYLGQLEIAKRELSGNTLAKVLALAEDTKGAVTSIHKGLLGEAAKRMEDPEELKKLSTQTILKAAESWTRLRMMMDNERGESAKQINNIQAIFVSDARLPEESRTQFYEMQQKFYAQKQKELEGAKDAAYAMDIEVEEVE